SPSSAFQTSEFNRSTGPGQHGAITAWAAGYSGQGIKIGIVDTGIDTTNPEFAGRIDPASRDVAGNRELTNPDSDHGTGVALAAAGARDNTGVMGIAFNSTIVMFRGDTPGTCADPDPKAGCTFSDSSIASGVNAAVAAGVKVINLSLGGSPPNATLRAAIVNAANAGVVVIVSAGNDGDSTDPAVDPANPDPMAAGLVAAGNGNVIIAGSVGAGNLISAFSNRAGTGAAWYLSARGERVCCTYENGVLKVVTNADGSRSVFVYSGTSFSAPQIAGAVALLREAFPNLTAQQVVELLLRTASDAGDPGTDPIYGRGILNITSAFAPQGATSLAGSTTAIPLGDTTLVTSGPMGDAKGRSAGVSAIVLDSYDRAYQYNIGSLIRSADLQPRLAPALSAHSRNVSFGNDRLSLAFTVDSRGRIERLAWQSGLRMSGEDQRMASVLAGRVVMQLTPKARAAFGFSQGADGLVSQLQQRESPGFLIARAPGDNPGFGQDNLMSFAMRQQLGSWGFAASAEHGTAITAAPAWTAASQLDRRRYEAADRFGLSVDTKRGNLQFALGASWLDEKRTILGARFNDGFASSGAESVFADLGASWRPGLGWRLGANLRGGATYPRSAGTIAGGRMLSSAWSIDATREGFFGDSDSLSLRLAQPLRVERGGIALTLPVGYSYATLLPTLAVRTLDLAPQGRELDTEINWRSPLWGGSAMISLFYRTDPGHYASLPDDQGLAASWSRKF
ncbi:MAG: S8 family peptidase, partial [Novosphingobium sp.]|uniref:S8 family peptidase n=1 Tax=Novosphingobium sp. TaxID=1874826 RepID=UPI0032BAEEF2